MPIADRIAVITGASSGIGKETAKALAAQGWRVIGTGRDAGRMAEAEAEIRAVSTTGEVDMVHADLSSMAATSRAAEAIEQLTDRIDLLVNNAGGMAKELVLTAEGNDSNFAGNHLGPFLLTDKLTPLLRRAAAEAPSGSVRIIAVSSDASEFIPGLNWDDLQLLGNYNPGFAYCQAKLANVMHVRGLAGRLAEAGVVAHAVHPGYTHTNFINGADDNAQATMRSMEGNSAAEGADTVIWLATCPEGAESNGGYFFKRQPRAPNPVVDDPAQVERLWRETERILEGSSPT